MKMALLRPTKAVGLLLTFILYHKTYDLSRGFQKVFENFWASRALTIFTGGLVRLCSRLVPLYREMPSPLDIYIIPQNALFVNSFLKNFFENFYLDVIRLKT
jgi:hypothetical protein